MEKDCVSNLELDLKCVLQTDFFMFMQTKADEYMPQLSKIGLYVMFNMFDYYVCITSSTPLSWELMNQ
jgi:hypothetical protein